MKKAWIVDDDITYQSFLSSYLTTQGYNTRCFTDGEECLTFLNEKPDLVILDHNLNAELNGVDILRFIKNERPETFVICISSQEKISIVTDAYRFGSDDYIIKDSASLLRIKLRLEKIDHLMLLLSKKKRKINLYITATAIIAMAGIMFLCYLLIR